MKSVLSTAYEDSGDQSRHEHDDAGLSCHPANPLEKGMSSAVGIKLPYGFSQEVHSLQQKTLQFYSELICPFKTYFYVYFNIICASLCNGLSPWCIHCYSWVLQLNTIIAASDTAPHPRKMETSSYDCCL